VYGALEARSIAQISMSQTIRIGRIEMRTSNAFLVDNEISGT